VRAQKRNTAARDRHGNWPAFASFEMPCTIDHA